MRGLAAPNHAEIGNRSPVLSTHTWVDLFYTHYSNVVYTSKVIKILYGYAQ